MDHHIKELQGNVDDNNERLAYFPDSNDPDKIQ